jgi:hypothetical protein
LGDLVEELLGLAPEGAAVVAARFGHRLMPRQAAPQHLSDIKD